MSWSQTVADVEHRATGRCEYCRMHQSLQGATFHVEHVAPAVQGGESELPNLAWSCPGCNLHKSDRTKVTDPDTGESVPLFHPREYAWSDHFAWMVSESLVCQPSARNNGRVAVQSRRRLQIRQAEQLFGLFPPTDD